MGKFIAAALGAWLCLIASSGAQAGQALSDDQIRELIIQQSISSYPGNCPCPYNVARNGSRCGKRSAYSRPGGYSPLCYPDDVSDAQVHAYRQQHSR